jgi:hypothetical protein
MFGIICWSLLCALAVRSLLLITGSQRPASIRFLDALIFLFYAGCAALLFIFLKASILAQPQIVILAFIAFMLPIGVITLQRLRKPYAPYPLLFLFKVLLVLIILIAATLAVMMSGFQYLTEDRPVLKVIMTGNQKLEQVEWQPPKGVFHKEMLPAYEVVFQTPQGEPIDRIFAYGDQIAVKARTLRFRPILNAIGIRNLCKIEYVHNGYETAERFNTYPHHAWELHTSHPWIEPYQKQFWNYWEKYYRQEEKNSWVKSATVESTYFPLVKSDGSAFQGAYFLTLTSGGLSAVPLP